MIPQEMGAIPDRLAIAREQALLRCRKSDSFYFVYFVRKGVPLSSSIPYNDNDGRSYLDNITRQVTDKNVGFWALFDIKAGRMPVLLKCVTGETDVKKPLSRYELVDNLSPAETC